MKENENVTTRKKNLATSKLGSTVKLACKLALHITVNGRKLARGTKHLSGRKLEKMVWAGFVDIFLHLNLEMFGVSELFGAPGLTMVVEQNVSCSDVVQHATQAGGNLGGTRK